MFVILISTLFKCHFLGELKVIFESLFFFTVQQWEGTEVSFYKERARKAFLHVWKCPPFQSRSSVFPEGPWLDLAVCYLCTYHSVPEEEVFSDLQLLHIKLFKPFPPLFSTCNKYENKMVHWVNSSQSHISWKN